MAVQRFLILFGKLRSLRLSAEVSFKRFQQFRNCSVNVFERFVHVPSTDSRETFSRSLCPPLLLRFRFSLRLLLYSGWFANHQRLTDFQKCLR
jgi:hypothetical protein